MLRIVSSYLFIHARVNGKSRIKLWCPVPHRTDNLGSTRRPANFGAITQKPFATLLEIMENMAGFDIDHLDIIFFSKSHETKEHRNLLVDW